MQRANFLERMRERIVPDVVQERRVADDAGGFRLEAARELALGEVPERAAGEVIRAQRVLEA